MKQILKTTLLEYEKSTFLIDLVKHTNQKLYIEIVQTIQHDGQAATQQIKINPSVLPDIVNLLSSYYNLISNDQIVPSIQNKSIQKSIPKKFFSKNARTEIQNRYLKGVSIRDLTIQFDCKAELIEEILRNKGIAIVDNEITIIKTPKWFRRRRN